MKKLMLSIFALVFFLSFSASADAFRSELRVTGLRVPGEVVSTLNGRPFRSRIYNGYLSFDGNVDDYLVSGENVLELRLREDAVEPGVSLTNEVSGAPRQGRMSLSVKCAGADGRWKETQHVYKPIVDLPFRFTFAVTNAWPVRSQPWQGVVPEFTDQDREDVRVLIRSLASCYANLLSAASKETLYNLKRLEYEHQALLEGVSFEEKKKEVFAVWERMAPFCGKNSSDFSHYVVEAVPGVNVVLAEPPGGSHTFAYYPDGSFYGDCAASLRTKKSSGNVPLPKFFSKLNGRWYVIPGGENAEATFVAFEKRYWPLEKPDPLPLRIVPPRQVPLPADDEGPAWNVSDSGEGSKLQWRVVRNPQTNVVSRVKFVPSPKTSFTNDDPPDTFSGAPGYGAPGKIIPYATDSKLEPYLRKYGLTAGWFVRDPLPVGSQGEYFTRGGRCTNSIPFLLYTPKYRSAQKVPIIMFIPGNGELGTDLTQQFRQKTIFEVVTAPDFQKKHPCYLFVPMPPKVGTLRSSCATRLKNEGNLINDALLKIVDASQSPAIDTARFYLTGLSFGATAVYDFASILPERFAACVPISSVGTVTHLNPDKATCFWHFHNERDVKSPIIQKMLEELKVEVEARGGELKVSTFPDSGHDAWDKAWREEAVWEWVFSKRSGSAATTGLRSGDGVAPTGGSVVPICTSSIPADNPDHSLDRITDGLMATYFQSAQPATSDDTILLEYPKPVEGKIAIFSGTPKGQNGLTRGFVEVSPDGLRWSRAATFRQDGTCQFIQRSEIRFLRMGHTSSVPQLLVIREVSLEN